ncbi:MAG: VOC family protein [Gammaproteobacteria bacterium]|nr:VOC family protein [Gammaproteobacteria bacterium]NNF61668.1 VOC family protein [Gammaproteobacteria bacterium]NNM21234.1 VOC family protein [Gammaproteobacteria bacterium]
MTMRNPPEGYQKVTPYIIVKGLDEELGFLDTVFGTEVQEKIVDKSGAAKHAQLMIGDSMLMLGESPGDDYPPQPASLYIYVDDCDAVHNKALANGATEIMPPDDMYYGDRHGGIVDPAGIIWWIATHFEDVSHEELQRRSVAHSQ